MIRIVGGALRGRPLASPAGSATRPSAARLRQALFDVLLHAPWAGRTLLQGAHVLDLFAGTGALGLEALSRGAALAEFIERDPAALAALRANIATTGVADRARIIAGDACRPLVGAPARLVFLDPPYGRGLVASAINALARARRLTDDTLLIAELGRDEPAPYPAALDERAHGAGRTLVWRAAALPSPS